MLRSRYDVCRFLKSCRVHSEIFDISPRLERLRREVASFLIGQDLVEILKDKLLTEIAEISRRSHHVCEFLNLGKIKNEISSILPRSHWDCQDLTEIIVISPWCLWVSESWWDRCEISFISLRFGKKTNLAKTANISPRVTRLSRIVITQSFPDGMNNFLHWIKLPCGWPLAFYFSVRFQMQEAKKWSKDIPTWIGFIYQKFIQQSWMEQSTLLIDNEFCRSSWNFGLSFSNYIEQTYLWVTPWPINCLKKNYFSNLAL